VMRVNRGVCPFGRYKTLRRPRLPPRASWVNCLTHAHLPTVTLTRARVLD